MTGAEIERYTKGAVWRLQQQANFDYSLANLIGVSTARILSSDVEFPAIEDVYPDLFQEELKKKAEEAKAEKEREAAMTNSTNRFLAFALAHNAKMKKGVD